MKAFRKTITMLCVLALLLTLAPCVYAEEIDSDQVKSGSYTASEDLHVTDSGSITVSGTKDTTVTVKGGLDNEGKFTVKVPNKGGDVLIVVESKGTNNSGSITAEGSASAYIRNIGGLTNDQGGTITVNSPGDSTATSGMVGVIAKNGDLVNDGKIEANGSHYATVNSDGGKLTNSGEIIGTSTGGNMEDSGNVVVSATGDLTNKDTGKIEVTSKLDSTVNATNGSLTNDGTITLKSNIGSANVRGESLTNTSEIALDGRNVSVNASNGALTNSGTITAKGESTSNVSSWNADLVNDGTIICKSEDAWAGVSSNNGNLVNNGTIDATGNTSAYVWAVGGSLTNNEGNTISVNGKKAKLNADSMENFGDIALIGDQVIIAKKNDATASDAENAGESYLSGNEDFVNYGTITIESLEEAINGTYYGVNYVDVVDGREVIKGTALTNWTDGLENDEFTITLNDHDDKEGYTFYWMIGDQMFRPGEATFKLNGVTSIKEFWKEIINTITGGGHNEGNGGAKGNGNGYRVVTGLTVLDKDRNVLHQGEDYNMVVRDNYGRYKVLFTQDQLDNLPDGENLFYIIDANKVEHEYILVIPPRAQ